MSELSITIQDIGPLKKPVVITARPGIGVLTGFCGTGKTKCLEAISVALGNKDKGSLAPTEGKKRGTVECLGVVLNVSAGRITRTGDSEAASLEEFTLADLITPPVKDSAAKNRHGIKSLLRLTKADADPKLFYRLAGDQAAFEAVISPEDVQSADLVEMSGKVKRAFEYEARKITKLAEQEEAAAAADRDAMKGLADGPCDPKLLQQAHTEAVQLHARLDSEWNAFWNAQEAAEEAKKKLVAAGAKTAVTLGNAQKALREAQEKAARCATAITDAKTEVNRLKAELTAAESVLASRLLDKSNADDAIAVAENGIKAVEETSKAYAGWQAQIEAAEGGTMPDETKLAEAKSAVDAAQKAMEHGAVLRNAKARTEAAAQHQKKADEYRKAAQKLDLAAKGTDMILSEAVASTRFSVDSTLLMGTLPGGETKPFYDLSAGEKCMIAVAEKIDRVCAVRTDPAQLAIVDLDQSNFQEIPDSVRDRLDQYARERNCFISTGMVTDDAELGYFLWTDKHTEASKTER